MLKIERINFFFENAIRGGPKSRYPPSEIFENAIRGGGPNKWFPPSQNFKKVEMSPPPLYCGLESMFMCAYHGFTPSYITSLNNIDGSKY